MANFVREGEFYRQRRQPIGLSRAARFIGSIAGAGSNFCLRILTVVVIRFFFVRSLIVWGVLAAGSDLSLGREQRLFFLFFEFVIIGGFGNVVHIIKIIVVHRHQRGQFSVHFDARGEVLNILFVFELEGDALRGIAVTFQNLEKGFAVEQGGHEGNVAFAYFGLLLALRFALRIAA